MFSLTRISALSSRHRLEQIVQRRSYHITNFIADDAAANPDLVKDSAVRKQLAARDYNNRRAAYNRHVSRLRRDYAEMISKQRAADKAEQEAKEKELTRRRLERQRLKNIRSAQNAIKQKELREQRAREFQEHLRVQQEIRNSNNEIYMAARQLVVNELEEEAPLWLTTREEVDAAFTHEAEQLLWARPGGILGAPNPSLDAHFWEYETHTWHMNKTYKTKRQILVEDLVEQAYEEANVDGKFWTEERLQEQTEREERARLRAMVHSAGRTELLRKQKQLLEASFQTTDDEVPEQRPVPSRAVLNNNKALEEEGARILMQDPTKFFVFDRVENPSPDTNVDKTRSGYDGPTLGAPIGLRDPLREGSYQNKVFPVTVGKIPKPDMRSEREKKQQEREEKMLAAAAASTSTDTDGDFDIDLAAEQQTAEDLEPDLSYDDHEWDSDDDEWNKGLHPEIDADIINTPRERRYTEADIDWAIEKLEGKVKYLEQQFAVEVDNIKQQARASKRVASSTSTESPDSSDLDSVLLSLSNKEILALSDLDDRYAEGLSEEEITEALADIPSLSKEQIMLILTRDRSL